MSMAALADRVETKDFSENLAKQRSLNLPLTAETPMIETTAIESQPLNIEFLIPVGVVVIVSLLGIIGASFVIKSRRDT
jgi:hypothetical protein